MRVVVEMSKHVPVQLASCPWQKQKNAFVYTYVYGIPRYLYVVYLGLSTYA